MTLTRIRNHAKSSGALYDSLITFINSLSMTCANVFELSDVCRYEKHLLDVHGDRINLIMKEGHGDVDMLLVSQLPWMGVWGYEPDNHVISDILVPAATQYVGEMGPDGGANVTQMLQNTK
jgi:hypothetical protein